VEKIFQMELNQKKVQIFRRAIPEIWTRVNFCKEPMDMRIVKKTLLMPSFQSVDRVAKLSMDKLSKPLERSGIQITSFVPLARQNFLALSFQETMVSDFKFCC
jgi:hypothetical protein